MLSQSTLSSQLTQRIQLAANPTFKDKVLMTAVQWCHTIMNQPTTDSNVKLKLKAVEILNQPESFKDRIAFSVAALIDSTRMDSDESLWSYVADALDAISGQGV